MAKTETTTTVRELDGADLLDQLMSKPVNQRLAAVDGWLAGNADHLRDMLPNEMKPHAERFAARASFYIRTRPDIQECTPKSLVECTLKAAEYGFCLDGRMCHAVKHNTKVKNSKPERWEAIAVMMPDYKGLIAFAKRHKLIGDAWARNVHEGDTFELSEHNGKQEYTYKQSLTGGGETLGTFAIVTLPGGTFRVEYMPIADIEAIRERSKSWQSGFGPWKSDEGEMQKKTALRRILKTLTDDPGMLLLLASDDVDFGEQRTDSRPVNVAPSLDELRGRIGGQMEAMGAEPVPETEPRTGPHAPARSVENPEPPKPKRTRRTKAQMEADEKAARQVACFKEWEKRIIKVTADTYESEATALVDADLSDSQYEELSGRMVRQRDGNAANGKLFEKGNEAVQ